MFRSITRLLFFTFVFYGHAYAQKSYIFDSNCRNFATDKKNVLVKGNLEADQRWERYFNWDNITPTYKTSLEKINTLTKMYPHLKPSDISLKEKKPIQETDTFKSYCIESIAKMGIQEELDKWSSHAKNCMDTRYRQRHPTHDCSYDMVEKLNYLGFHAQKLAKMDNLKSPATRKFYQDAYINFSKFANDMDSLVKSQKDSLKLAIEKENQKKKVEDVTRSFDKCREVVDNDGNDINGRNLADKVLAGLGPCASTESSPKDTLAQLVADIKKINSAVMKVHLYDELNQESISLSLNALWSSLETFGMLGANGNVNREKELRFAACGLHKSLCLSPNDKLFNEILKKYLKNTHIKKITEAESTAAIKLDFNNNILKINQYCKEAREEVSQALGIMHGFGKLTKASPHKNFNVSDFKPKTMTDMNIRSEEYFREKQRIKSKYESLMNSHYNNILQTRFAPLLLNSKLREKVGGRDIETCSSLDKEYLSPAKTISPKDFENAQKDYITEIHKELSKLQSNIENKNDIEKNIKDYLKTHPDTISSLLTKNPDHKYALLLCRYIREINSLDKKRQIVSSVAIGAGVIASGALAMTGIGAPIAPVLMTTIGTLTATEVGMSYQNYKEARHQANATLQAGATGQMNFELALRESEQWNNNADSQVTNIIIIIGSEVAGFGAGKLIAMMGKLKNARFIRLATKGLKNVEGMDAATLDLIKSGLERFEKLAKAKGLSKTLTNSMTSEEIMELGALFSRLDDSAAKLVMDHLKHYSPNDLSRFLDDLAQSPEKYILKDEFNLRTLTSALENAKNKRLPGNLILEDVMSSIHTISDQIHPLPANYSSLTIQFEKKLGKDAVKTLDQYIDLLEPDSRIKLLNAVDKNQNKTLEALSQIGCLKKSGDPDCFKRLENAIQGLPLSPTQDLKKLAQKINNIDNNLSEALKNSRLSQLEITHLSENLPKGALNAKEQMDLAEYIEFLSSKSFKDRMKGIESAQLLVREAAPQDAIIKEFKKLQTEALKRETKWANDATKRLKKDLNIDAQEIPEMARKEALVKRRDWQNRAASCRSNASNPYMDKGLKKFDRFNVTAAPIYNAASYILANLDKEKDSLWFKELGWGVITSMVYGKIPGYIMKNKTDSNLAKLTKENLIGTGIGFADSLLFTYFIGDDKNKKKIEERLNDQGFKESVEKLNEKMSELILKPEFSQILERYKDQIVELNSSTLEEEIDMSELSNEEFKADPELQKLYMASLTSTENPDMLSTGSNSYDRFIFNQTYSWANAPKRIFLYKTLQRQLCMGNMGAAIALYSADKLFSGMLYYKGRAHFIGQ